MTRTHHATRAFRLSCGCIRDYPGMPASQVHELLCPVCNCAAITTYAYPERSCGARNLVAGTRVQCTNDSGNRACEGGVHTDSFTGTTFRLQPDLRKSNEGETRRA